MLATEFLLASLVTRNFLARYRARHAAFLLLMLALPSAFLSAWITGLAASVRTFTVLALNLAWLPTGRTSSSFVANFGALMPTESVVLPAGCRAFCVRP